MNMLRLPEVKYHNLITPIRVAIEDRDEVYEVIEIKSPSYVTRDFHRHIEHHIARALNKRSIEMQKNMSADIIKNMQEVQKLIEQLRESDEAMSQVNEQVEKKKAKAAKKEEKVEASTDLTDKELLQLYDQTILAHLTMKEGDDLLEVFMDLLKSSAQHKCFMLFGYDKPITPLIIQQLSTDDLTLLLMKYIYFFTRLRPSLLGE